ncbi:16S rRNA processing protein RimM [bacterium]|nr:16S rRNA processing protein RimM [bacterium]
MSDFIPIGKIVKTHGLKGGFKMAPFDHDTTFFDYTKKLYLKIESDFKEFNIENIQNSGKSFLIKLKEIKSIEDAEKLISLNLFVLKAEIPIEDDEILLSDMIGYKIYSDNDYLGILDGFADYGAGLIYVVLSDDGKTYFLPDQDEFIKESNYDEKFIIFTNIQDFL